MSVRTQRRKIGTVRDLKVLPGQRNKGIERMNLWIGGEAGKALGKVEQALLELAAE